MIKKFDILLFGGDRLMEKGPLSYLASFLKKKGIKFIIFTDPIHLKKKVNNKKNFKKILKKERHNFYIYKKLKFNIIKRYIGPSTLGLSINSIWKFDQKIIKLFNGRLYNYHAADLPTERGGANISWRILLNKKKNLSINIHKVTTEFDTGDIVKNSKIIIKKNDIFPYHHLQKIQFNEKKLLKQFIIDYSKGRKFMKKIQKNEKSYYWPRLNSDKDGLINWDWTAKEVVDFIRAFSKPYNGSFSFLNKKKIRIFDAIFVKSKVKFHPFQNGLIFRFHKNYFYIANREHYIKISKKNLLGLNKNPSFYLGKKFSNI